VTRSAVGAGLKLERNAVPREALRDSGETLLVGVMLPGEQPDHDQRSERYGQERRAGVFQFEADGVHCRSALYRATDDSPLILRGILRPQRRLRPPE
jgi:hypothetical protein